MMETSILPAISSSLPAPTPTPTPAPSAFIPQAPLPGINRRFQNATFTTSVTAGPGCSKFNGFQTCSSGGDYGSCLASSDAELCNCNNGLQYLDCVSAALATSTCAGAVGIDDWDAYERSWFQSSCPTPPSSVMTLLPQPTSVDLDLEPVSIVIPPGPISEPARPAATPNYREGGELLKNDCASASFTLIDGGDMVYYAAFVGCNADRPQCCPWNVSTDASAPRGNRVAAAPGLFPEPARDAGKDAAVSALDRCPQDYYSVSGQCCPNGYYKFTREIARQTPCFSSLGGGGGGNGARATPPPITAGLAANPTDSSRPTSAVVNLAWAMGLDVAGADTRPRLSTGATVGIGVGAGVAAIVVAAAAWFFVVRWRRGRRDGRGKSNGGAGALPDDAGDGQHGMTYRAGYHPPLGSSPPPMAKADHGHGAWEPYRGGGGGAWDSGYQAQQQAAGYDGYYRR